MEALVAQATFLEQRPSMFALNPCHTEDSDWPPKPWTAEKLHTKISDYLRSSCHSILYLGIWETTTANA